MNCYYTSVHVHMFLSLSLFLSQFGRCRYAACHTNESRVTLFDFSPPGACHSNVSDWPFELSEKLSKGWEELGRFQKPGWACLLKSNTVWHFYPLAQTSDVWFFSPTAEMGATRSLGRVRILWKYKNHRMFQLSLNGGHVYFQSKGW